MPDENQPANELIPGDIPTVTRKDRRVELVMRWLVQAKSVSEIHDEIRAAWPEESWAELLLEAMKKLEEAGALGPALVLGFCTEATLQLYKDYRAAGDYDGALKAIKVLASLHL